MQFNWWRISARRVASAVSVVVVLAVWQLVTMLEIYPSFIVPPPIAVAEKFVIVIEDGRLWIHFRTTLISVLSGMFLGVSIGITLGYLIARSKLLEDLLSPLVIAFQATPIISYAPLLIIWFGSGLESKVIISALIVFFPMLMNTMVGIRNVPQSLHDLMRTSRATWWQTFTKLEVPAALPVLMNGMRISATLAVIGAVVGEFVGAKAGLGFLIGVARNQFDTPLVFVAVFTLTAMALTLYIFVVVVEHRLLAWQRRVKRD